MSNVSSLDLLVRRLMIFTQFFSKGWGDPQHLKSMINFRRKLSQRQQFVPRDYPVYIDQELDVEDGVRILQGHFKSPFVDLLPGVMPKATETARFQLVIPTEWKTDLKPMCIHIARSGDHSFDNRRNKMAIPLLKEDGIGSIILENPFYGQRKPNYQIRSNLSYVSDLFVMGGAVIFETQVLFHWCERMGFGPLGIHGMSLGGFMTSMAASCWHKPISVIPCMSGSTASVVYTEGPLKSAIPWDVLEEQFLTDPVYATEIMAMIHSPEPSRKKKLAHKEILGQEVKNHRAAMPTQQTDTPNTTPANIGPYTVSRPSLPLRKRTMDRQLSWGTKIHSKSSVVVLEGNAKEPLNIIVNTICSLAESLSLSVVSGYISEVMSSVAIAVSGLKPSWMLMKQKSELTADCEHFMRVLMDECTHLENYPVPVDPELAVIVVGDYDAYMPMGSVLALDELWPGAEVRYIPHGHVSGMFSGDGRRMMRKAIRDSFKKQIDKYY